VSPERGHSKEKLRCGSDRCDNEDVLFLVELSLRKKEEGAMGGLLENIRKERQAIRKHEEGAFVWMRN
jgi:hypothetical protein